MLSKLHLDKAIKKLLQTSADGIVTVQLIKPTGALGSRPYSAHQGCGRERTRPQALGGWCVMKNKGGMERVLFKVGDQGWLSEEVMSK